MASQVARLAGGGAIAVQVSTKMTSQWHRAHVGINPDVSSEDGLR
jgi:hypothetical protein